MLVEKLNAEVESLSATDLIAENVSGLEAAVKDQIDALRHTIEPRVGGFATHTSTVT